MKNDLFTILKDLKNIKPEQKYSKQSRLLILSSPIIETRGNKIADWFNFSHIATSVAVLSVFIFIVFWTVSYLPGNKNGLVAEADELNASIQIKLDEIKYHINSQPINSLIAVDIQNLLIKTADELAQAKELSSDIDKLKETLEKIKEVEKNIAKINSLLAK